MFEAILHIVSSRFIC